MKQLDLFAEQSTQEEFDEWHGDLINPSKCGTCAYMNMHLPGNNSMLGRCVNPGARAYYLSPENTRPNIFHDGRIEYPNGGSWAYVAHDSAGCSYHKRKKE